MLIVEIRLRGYANLPDVVERIDLIRDMIGDGRDRGWWRDGERAWHFTVWREPENISPDQEEVLSCAPKAPRE